MHIHVYIQIYTYIYMYQCIDGGRGSLLSLSVSSYRSIPVLYSFILFVLFVLQSADRGSI